MAAIDQLNELKVEAFQDLCASQTIDGFDAQVVSGVPLLAVRSTDVVAAFTTRIGGNSAGALASLNLSRTAEKMWGTGDVELVPRNAAAVNGALGLAADTAWDRIRQVHSSEIVAAGSSTVREADGLVLGTLPGAILTADCVALVVVGARTVLVHAGWRGMAAGILERAIALASPVTEVFAGPAIGPCCFEVQDDVRNTFREKFGATTITHSGNVNLWESARVEVERTGVSKFFAARLCTSCNPEVFFSHRRDEGATGRQALIGIANQALSGLPVRKAQ